MLKKICINRVMFVIEWSSWENEEKKRYELKYNIFIKV